MMIEMINLIMNSNGERMRAVKRGMYRRKYEARGVI